MRDPELDRYSDGLNDARERHAARLKFSNEENERICLYVDDLEYKADQLMDDNFGFKGSVPGAWKIPDDVQLTGHVSQGNPTVLLPNLAFFIPDVLSAKDCLILRELFSKQDRASVSVSGYQSANPNEIGSQRATGWGPQLGEQLWRKINKQIFFFVAGIHCDDTTPTDWYPIPGKRKAHKIWIPTGISPVLRFMEYSAGGRHNTHYDMGYDYEALDLNDKRRTLLSIVWYLNDEPNSGGRTRFIKDNQDHLPIFLRNLDDWIREAREDEVIAQQAPIQGGALVFWHRMAHDVSQFTGNSRVIIRGDVEFTALD